MDQVGILIYKSFGERRRCRERKISDDRFKIFLVSHSFALIQQFQIKIIMVIIIILIDSRGCCSTLFSHPISRV